MILYCIKCLIFTKNNKIKSKREIDGININGMIFMLVVLASALKSL